MLGVHAAGLLAVYAVLLWKAQQAGGWLVDRHGAPARVDFVEFWGAGRLALEGRAAAAYDWNAVRALLPNSDAFAHVSYPFFYPPIAFLLVAPMAAVPFAVSAAIWVVSGYAAYLAAVRAITRDRTWLLLAAATPAAFCCISVGQNGLVTAALLGGALALLDRRPLVAGLLIGAMAYKPHFALLAPFALAASGRWRTFAAAAATALALAILSGALFGWGSWVAFLHGLTGGQGVPAVSTLEPAKLQSIYGLVRAAGGADGLAWSAQGLCALMAAGFVVAHWRSREPQALKSAGLIAATLLATPYACIYDLPIAGVGVSLILTSTDRRRFAAVEWSALAAAYALPLVFFFRPAPCGPLIGLLMLAVAAGPWLASRLGLHAWVEVESRPVRP